jgi:vacuolar-type H+-ATPase subunit B/Vma2
MVSQLDQKGKIREDSRRFSAVLLKFGSTETRFAELQAAVKKNDRAKIDKKSIEFEAHLSGQV